MSDPAFRRVARAGLAPLVEAVPDGPDWADLDGDVVVEPSRTNTFAWMAGVAAALVVLVVIGVTAFLGGGTDPEPPAIAIPSVSTPPESSPGLEEFDILLFARSKLSGAFEDFDEQIGVVVLVPEPQQAALDRATVSLGELFGLTYVPVNDVAAAAARFSEANGMSLLEGRWVAYGLEPEFDDTPTDSWLETLQGIPGAVVAQVDFTPMDFAGLADGWSEVARIGVSIPSGSVVEAVDGAVVIVQSASTIVVDVEAAGAGLEGSWTEDGPPPFPFQDQCCGGTSAYPVGEDLLVLSESSTETWLFDRSEFLWRELDPRPFAGFVLGSARVGQSLTIVEGASRSSNPTSRVANLDLNTGSWGVLPSLPSPVSVGGVANDDGRVIVAGAQQDGNNRIIGGPYAFQLVGSEWQTITGPVGESRLPFSGQAATVSWVENVGLLAWNYDLNWSILDANGTWGPIGQVPMDFAECYPTTVQALDGVVALCGGIAWFDARTLEWTRIPYPSYTGERLIVSGSSLLALIDSGRDTVVLAKYPLPPG